MATYKGRPERVLKQVVERIAPQVDELHIYMNDYTSVPSWMDSISNVHSYLGKDNKGDLKARGKFWAYDKAKGYYLTVDDDLDYDPNYVRDTIEKIESSNKSGVFVYRGKRINSLPLKHYYFKRGDTQDIANVNNITRMHVPNTGTFFVDRSKIKLNVKELLSGKRFERMIDPCMAVLCIEQGIPVYCLPKQLYKTMTGEAQRKSIYLFNKLEVKKGKDRARDFLNSRLSNEDLL